MAVCSNEAAKSAICSGVSKVFKSFEGKSRPTPTSFWTWRRTAVFRPEKEKSRPGVFG